MYLQKVELGHECLWTCLNTTLTIPLFKRRLFKRILNIVYIFLIGSGQFEGFIYEPEIEPIQFGFRKMNPTLLEMLIQPNPTQPL